jgi:hypothetical protein
MNKKKENNIMADQSQPKNKNVESHDISFFFYDL